MNNEIMNNEINRINLKSLYYKLSSKSIGYNVYKNDDSTKILFGKLVCSKCGRTWETGETECYYCGTPNYHLYTCIQCGRHYSITDNNKRCPICNGKLQELCLNSKCPTNNKNKYPKLYNAVRSKGIFSKKGGFFIRHNSCKYCGSLLNNYKFAEIKVVFSYKQLKKDINNNRPCNKEVYIERYKPRSNDFIIGPAKKCFVLDGHKIFEYNNIKNMANNITSIY